MSNQKHTIFAFVGASGSGKSTLMVELLSFLPHLQIIKSTSTRPRRDETDDLFYKFVETEFVEAPQNQVNFLNQEIYNGNHYVYERSILDGILSSHCGMLAILESAVPKLQAHGYSLTLIKVIPDRDWALDRSVVREVADRQRETTSKLVFDFTIENSFKPGGLEKSVEALSKFIKDIISSHVS
jgi:guanylate kinase